MIDYMIYVRYVIGIGLLLAGGVSLMFDHSNSQIVISSMALILGVLFVCMAKFPRNTGIRNDGLEGIDLEEEEKIHLDNIEVNDESVKKYLEESDKVLDDMKKKGARYSNEIGKGGRA